MFIKKIFVKLYSKKCGAYDYGIFPKNLTDLKKGKKCKFMVLLLKVGSNMSENKGKIIC